MALKKLFGKRTKLSAEGKYELRLWSWGSKDWVTYVIDDRFACDSDVSPMPSFAKMSDDNEIFPMLIEKAVAIMAGGFDYMNSIMPTWALAVLTGCPDVVEYDRAGTMWTGFCPVYGGNSTCVPVGTHTTDVWPDHSDGKNAKSNEEMWAYLQNWDDNNYLICCGAAADGTNDKMDNKGIYFMHAYSLLQVRTNIAGTGISLLTLRNPHGTGGKEPDLPWKDNDMMWKKHPKVAEACGVTEGSFKSDGLFHISKEDFFTYFNTLYLLRCNMDVKERRHPVRNFLPAVGL